MKNHPPNWRAILTFLLNYLAVSKESLTFVTVKRESFKDITVMRAKQEIFISEAKKLQDYLVVPNNLLLSLSLSLGIQAYSHFSFFLIAYAREARRALQ